MDIVSWNVNGLRSVLRKNLGDFLSLERPHILCLQETKVYPEVLPTLAFYAEHYFNHCTTKKGYSGTAVWTDRKPLQARCIDVESTCAEGRVMVLEYRHFYLINVYVPNSQNELLRLPYRCKVWDVAFRDYLKGLQKPLIVCGDFNVAHEPIDLAHPESNHFNPGFTDEERGNFSHLLDIGLVDIFRQRHPHQPHHYTWWSYRAGARRRNIGWRIDYFLVSSSLTSRVTDCTILKHVEGSDHAPVRLTVSDALWE
ncbi:MAG: exodeoxyribonuclease III [Puniceicoccales bacterium]|nr:exodeoxyribonuclease III [Puniceicoccales bacterium]